MKKLMIATAAVLLGIVANAATYSWAMGADWISTDGENALEGSVYIWDANVYSLATIAGELASGNTSSYGNALGSTSIVDGGILSSDFSGTGLSAVGDPAKAQIFAIILDDGTDGQYFYQVSMNAATIASVHELGNPVEFSMGEVTTGTIGGDGWTAVAVPEPTSGLLMLLGMAGLALRRRRA